MTRIRAVVGFILVPAFLACSSSPSPATAPAARAAAERQLRQATQHFADLILAMDHAAIAALFTPDGEMVAEGQPPIRGAAEIGKHLEAFKDFHVLAESMSADTITIDGAAGHVAGTFHQRVRLPSGEVEEVSGGYTADWVRDAAGGWQIRRMATTSKP